MKIQCDVCDQEEASLFCVADEAALCSACDRRVHHANKLAGKHHRFSLHRPDSKQSPLCDICQDRRGFVLCQQDKAILCKDCDASIHGVNERTREHTRLLLTGVEVAFDSAPPVPENRTIDESETSSCNTSSMKKNRKSKQLAEGTIDIGKSTTDGRTPESDIFSEYLIDVPPPGWYAEDQLLDSFPAFHGFSKLRYRNRNLDNFYYILLSLLMELFFIQIQKFQNVGNELLQPNWGNSKEKQQGIWVPNVNQKKMGSSLQSGEMIGFGGSYGLKEIGSKNTKRLTMKRRNEDTSSSLAVPQISKIVSKRR